MARPNAGARLTLNERGVYEIRWSENRRSQRLSTRTDDLQAAQRFLAGWLMERERARTETTVVTVGYVLRLYLDDHVEDGTVVDKRRQRVCFNNLMTFFADIPCRDIDMDHTKEYAELRRDKRPIENGTLRRELNMLKAAMHHAVKRKKMTLADMSYIHLPPDGEPKQLWFTEAERDQILAAADKAGGRLQMFVYLGLCTASRRAAIERLTWDKVDLQAKLIRYDLLPGPKTAKRRVPVPISDRLLKVLLAAKIRSRSPYVVDNGNDMFSTFQSFCERMYKATGNEKFLEATPHTMRHTWATLAARAGVSMYEIAGVLGDTVTTVEKNYLKHSPEHLRSAVNF